MLKGKDGDRAARRHPAQSGAVEGGSVESSVALELRVFKQGVHLGEVDRNWCGCPAEAAEWGRHPGGDSV